MIKLELRDGRMFDLENPDPNLIDIGDIAWVLARTGRFGHRTDQFYSVAEHSILMTQLVDHKLWALLHDGPEAYIGDVHGPLKAKLPRLKEIEAQLLDTIATRFKLTPTKVPAEVWAADKQMLYMEKTYVKQSDNDWQIFEDLQVSMPDFYPYFWKPEVAESIFLRHFEKLKKPAD